MTSEAPVPAPSAPQPRGRIAALDGLRGVAAVMVLLHHTLLMLPDFAASEWGVPGAQPHGVAEWLLIRTPLRLLWAGQERALLFFVLSGFVLGLPWVNGRSAPYGRFLLGRFCRIYPPYLIMMALAAAGCLLIGGHALPWATVYFNQLGWALRPGWAAVPSIVGVLDNRSSGYLNEAVWTLVWEARVALIFPLLMLPIIRWRNLGILGVLAMLALLKHVGSRLVGPWAADVLTMPEDTFYYAQYFVFGIAMAVNRGAIVAWFGRRRAWVGVACVGLGCLVCWLPWPMQHDHIVGIGAAMILAAILGSLRVQSALTTAPLLWLGERSYSLYLVHVPLIMAAVIALHGRVSALDCGGMAVAAVGLAWLYYRCVEMPSVAMAQRLTGYARPKAARARDEAIPRTVGSALPAP